MAKQNSTQKLFLEPNITVSESHTLRYKLIWYQCLIFVLSLEGLVIADLMHFRRDEADIKKGTPNLKEFGSQLMIGGDLFAAAAILFTAKKAQLVTLFSKLTGKPPKKASVRAWFVSI